MSLFFVSHRYYYNKRTKQSVWDKPLELMTPIEVSFYADIALALVYVSSPVPCMTRIH